MPRDHDPSGIACGSAVCGASMTSLFSRRVHFVVGKGGVGKTTVAVALALIAAREGKSVLLIEMEPGGGAGGLLGMVEPAGYEARRSPAGVCLLQIDGRASLEEYLRLVVPVRRVLTAVFRSKIYQYFVAAAPGLKELMVVGKVWYEAERTEADGSRRWDVIVVDGPATGHSLQYLRMPRAARDAFGPGLVRQEAQRVEVLLEDPEKTEIDLVTMAEEVPVTETIETYSALTSELRLPMGMLVVNRVHRGTAPDELVRELQLGGKRLSPEEARVSQEIAARAAEENARAAMNRAQIERLHEAVPLPTLLLPDVFAEEFGAREALRVSELLEAGWRVRGRTSGRQPRGKRS